MCDKKKRTEKEENGTFVRYIFGKLAKQFFRIMFNLFGTLADRNLT